MKISLLGIVIDSGLLSGILAYLGLSFLMWVFGKIVTDMPDAQVQKHYRKIWQIRLFLVIVWFGLSFFLVWRILILIGQS